MDAIFQAKQTFNGKRFQSASENEKFSGVHIGAWSFNFGQISFYRNIKRQGLTDNNSNNEFLSFY